MKNVKSETGSPLVSFYNPLGKKTPPAQNTGTMKKLLGRGHECNSMKQTGFILNSDLH